jgi:C-terminal processing protease CtpA/Prc
LNLAFDGRIYTSELSWERTVTQTGTKWERRSNVDYKTDLESFIREIDQTYPFFELKGIREDWNATCERIREEVKECKSDQDFLGLVMDAVRCLRDGHMGFRQVNADMPPWPRKYFPGISFMPATENRVVLMTDRTDLDADLKRGTIVTRINGIDARQVLEERAKDAWAKGGGFSSPQRARLYEFRIPLRDEEKGKKHIITISVAGKERDIEVASGSEARGWPHWYNRPENMKQAGSYCWYVKLPSGIGYIYLRRIDGNAGKGMKEAFSTHADAKGWIIDLRGNGGGGYGSELYEALRSLPRPLAGIIDAGCFSAGETMARDLVRYGNARLFGSPTAGSSSSKRTWSFPSGIGTLSLPSRSRWGISGSPIEFNGISPDENVEAVPEEVQNGKNSAILRAEEYLAEIAAAATQ